jgi:2-polyprenyl-6-methoxyphenol hydroxylase-like FAD-dependent oxidoreductase
MLMMAFTVQTFSGFCRKMRDDDAETNFAVFEFTMKTAIVRSPSCHQWQLPIESFAAPQRRSTVEPLPFVNRKKHKIMIIMEKARMFSVLLLVLLCVPVVPLVMASLESVSCPSRDISAIVIGAGPAGLVTALGLSKLCREVHLIEKHPTFEQRGSTFGIMPNGRKALAEIDPTLWGDLEQVGIVTPNGGLMLPWWEMRDAVLRKVKQTENIILRAGETLVDIDDGDSEGVRASFESGLELSADFLVGSDGVHSFVRNWLGLPPAIETNSTVFRGSLIVTDESSKELKALLDLGLVPMGSREFEGMFFMVFNFHSKHPGRLLWTFSTTKQLDESASPMLLLRQAVTDEGDLRLMEEIFDRSDVAHLKPYRPTSVVDFSDDILATLEGRWGGRGQVTLTGDAAHACRPTDGQGGNQAFEDAVVLCRTLKDDLPVLETLRKFEETRLPRVKRIHDDQRIRYENRMRGVSVGPQALAMQQWIAEGV